MDPNSAPGPDGFNGYFYSFCWEIIKQDLFEAISELFAGGELPISWTSTSILPIPKKDNPSTFQHFRPINLCNYSNKIISKLLMIRLTNILPKLISDQQGGFVRRRIINDNILLANELIQDIRKEVMGSNIVIKLDVSKAYDSLNWFALIKVMRQFGFDERWIDMIWRLVSNCWYSVLVNGTSCGHFTSSRGLRQGDPLSPFLYIIASEVLSRGLNTLQAKYPYTRFRSSPNCPSTSHLSYADDLIIFCNGSTPSLKKHMELLEKVHNFLGLEINKSKSCYINERPNSSRDTIIKSITVFQKESLSIEYLGCPLYRGSPRKD